MTWRRYCILLQCILLNVVSSLALSGTPQKIDPAALPLLQPAKAWVWLVDLERACALLVGRILGSMLIGPPLSKEEKDCEPWLSSPVLHSGLEARNPELGKLISHIRLGRV